MGEIKTVRKLGFVFALPEEKAGFEQAMSESRSYARRDNASESWYIGALEVMAAISGPGRKTCERSTRALIDQGAQWIISAGFAAALDPLAKVGDIYVASRVLMRHDHNSPPIRTNALLDSVIPPGSSAKFTVRHSDIVTVDRVIARSSEKTAIYRATGAGALDMESYAVAEVCAQAGIPFTSIRSVTDSANQDLPRDIAAILNIPDSVSRFIYSFSRPRLWIPLVRLRSQSRIAAVNLGDVLGMVILRIM